MARGNLDSQERSIAAIATRPRPKSTLVQGAVASVGKANGAAENPGLGAPRRPSSAPYSGNEVRRYATQVVEGLNLRPGQPLTLLLRPGQRDLELELVEAAYRAGAGFVAPVYEIDGRFMEPSPNGFALANQSRVVNLLAEQIAAGSAVVQVDDNNVDHGIIGDLVRAVDAHLEGDDRISELFDGAEPWAIVHWPSRSWAKRVFPELEPDEAFRALSNDLKSFAHFGDDETISWQQHIETLKARSQAMSALGIQELIFTGEGTELKVGILPETDIIPVNLRTPDGQVYLCNQPTQELFTTPDPHTASGTFACSKPLVLPDGEGGTISINGIRGRFENGELVDMTCDDPAYADAIFDHFASQEGATRLGEIGLVDTVNRIGASGRTYHNGIIDENSGTHIALGSSYDAPIRGEGIVGNQSDVHYDLTIGEPSMDIYGTDRHGMKVPLIIGGIWQV